MPLGGWSWWQSRDSCALCLSPWMDCAADRQQPCSGCLQAPSCGLLKSAFLVAQAASHSGEQAPCCGGSSLGPALQTNRCLLGSKNKPF